jgi:hypothetical protein
MPGSAYHSGNAIYGGQQQYEYDKQYGYRFGGRIHAAVFFKSN